MLHELIPCINHWNAIDWSNSDVLRTMSSNLQLIFKTNIICTYRGPFCKTSEPLLTLHYSNQKLGTCTSQQAYYKITCNAAINKSLSMMIHYRVILHNKFSRIGSYPHHIGFVIFLCNIIKEKQSYYPFWNTSIITTRLMLTKIYFEEGLLAAYKPCCQMALRKHVKPFSLILL